MGQHDAQIDIQLYLSDLSDHWDHKSIFGTRSGVTRGSFCNVSGRHCMVSDNDSLHSEMHYILKGVDPFDNVNCNTTLFGH